MVATEIKSLKSEILYKGNYVLTVEELRKILEQNHRLINVIDVKKIEEVI